MVLVSLKPFLFYYAQQADYVIKNLGNLEPLIMTLFQQLLLSEGGLTVSRVTIDSEMLNSS